jgi:hypothetical protein
MSQPPPTSDEPEFALPFEWMDSGESFFLPTLRPAYMVYIINAQANLAKVRVRVYPATKDGLLGVRVWRV